MIQSALFCARPAHIWSRCAFVDGCPAGFDWTRGGMEKGQEANISKLPLGQTGVCFAEHPKEVTHQMHYE